MSCNSAFNHSHGDSTSKSGVSVDCCLLTTSQVAEKLNCSTATIARHIAAGRIEVINIGSGSKRADYRIRPSALQDFLEGRTVAKPKYSGIRRAKTATVPNYFS